MIIIEYLTDFFLFDKMAMVIKILTDHRKSDAQIDHSIKSIEHLKKKKFHNLKKFRSLEKHEKNIDLAIKVLNIITFLG